MERINYFTGKFSGSELEDYFDSLNEEKLKFELENFINQYLKLSEEEQLKYAGPVLDVCMNLTEKIGKTTAKNILVTLNKILLNNVQSFDWFESFKFLTILYFYLYQTKEYEDYYILFENESYFFKILDLICNYNIENSEIIFSDILSVFVKLFEQNSLPEERRNYFKRELESFINFIFKENSKDNVKDNDFKHIVYWYFELDELLSIFRTEHLEKISNYYINNPQSDSVGKYLDFVSRHFDDIIEDSIEVIRKIAKENDSDIIRDQAIKLVKMYDESDSSDKGIFFKKERDSNFILSENYKELLDQAEDIIDDIRSNLTVAAKDLKQSALLDIILRLIL